MRDLVIQPKEHGKGRAFGATLIAHVTADRLWAAGSQGDSTRPVYMALAGTETELRPFVANLRLGRKAEHGYKGREKFEVLKSAGFQVAWQRAPAGCLVSIFAPDLFCLDPGMVDPKGVSFCVLPAKAWLRPLDVPVPVCVPDERRADVLSLASLFIAYLDRRTRCPLVPDPRFYVAVLAGALEQGLASWSRGGAWGTREWGRHDTSFVEDGTDLVGLAPGVVFRSSHDELEAFLAEQVKAHFAKEPAAS